jgi:hypothetical protein
VSSEEDVLLDLLEAKFKLLPPREVPLKRRLKNLKK